MKRYSRVVATLAGAAALCAASQARAATCNFTGDNVVYVGGSSASQPVWQYVAPLLASYVTPALPNGVQLVYIKSESCTGAHAMINGDSISTDPLGAAPGAVTALTWTASPDGGVPVSTSCTIAAPPAAGNPLTNNALLDASVSDVYAATCGYNIPAGQQEFGGPIQAMAIIADGPSTEKSISAEAAHIVFGDVIAGTAQTYPVSPWTDPSYLYIREPIAGGGSGTRLMIGAAIGLSDTQWSTAITNVFSSSGALVAATNTAPTPNGITSAANAGHENSTLGTVSTTVADSDRVGSASSTQVKVLAFQAKGQTCGYYPDSTTSSFDKINVREGRYAIWGPIHFITKVAAGDGGTLPASSSNPGNATADAALQALVNVISLLPGGTLTDDVKKAVIAAEANAHVVAQCAMKVQRNAEVGPEQSFLPPESCGCYWESVANGAAPATCTACPTGNECASLTATPTCRYGFCEAN